MPEQVDQTLYMSVQVDQTLWCTSTEVETLPPLEVTFIMQALVDT